MLTTQTKRPVKTSNRPYGKYEGEAENGAFRQASIQGSDFQKWNLRFVDMIGAEAAGSNFYRADLEGARFRDANLAGCDFTSAYLFRADFRGAVLTDATFRDAYLLGANLGSAARPAWLPAKWDVSEAGFVVKARRRPALD